MSMFVGREQEMGFFEDRYKAPGGQLVVLYGRRRVGKTEFLQQFCSEKPHVYYTCREIHDSLQLAAFSRRVLNRGSAAAKYIDSFGSWETALLEVAELPTNGKKQLLIVDEFPYMCKGNPSIPSILQVLWDEGLKNRNLMIVLCGSAMEFIEKKILSEKTPLYGRATGIYKMGELPFWDAIKFFPNYSAVDKFMAYAVLGGIPHYLRQFDPGASLGDNIVRNVLTKGSVLYSEVEFLIRQELREPAFYNALIEAVALGSTKLGDIHSKTQLERSKISVYLKNLIGLSILEREFPVLSSGKEQASVSRGLYRVTDSFFRFWFSFVSGNISDLEAGGGEGVYADLVAPQLNAFASPVFEQVCRNFIHMKSIDGRTPFRFAKIGRWWWKDAEIDIVAVGKDPSDLLVGECKFQNHEMDTKDYSHLHKKAALLKSGVNAHLALFSKSGFSKSLTDQSEGNDMLRLYSLDDVVAEN